MKVHPRYRLQPQLAGVTTKGKGKLYDDGKLIADFDNDTNHWYHHYGDVKDWTNEWQIKNCELCGLATFNENNTDFRRYIIDSIKMWLDKGVDALRIDTVKHMPNWFWQEFTCEMHTHKPNVFIFGEWINNHPTNQVSVDFANHSGMTVFDFGLCQAIRERHRAATPSRSSFKLVQDILNDQDGNYHPATRASWSPSTKITTCPVSNRLARATRCSTSRRA